VDPRDPEPEQRVNQQPFFVVLEGIDACGKETQSKFLAEELRDELHREVLLVSFPRYETPLGKLMRRHLRGFVSLTEERTRDSSDPVVDGLSYHVRAPEDALAFQALMIADKADAAADIQAALGRGTIVVADRWWPSAYAYGKADGLDWQWLIHTHAALPQPNLNILLDISADESLRRSDDPERRKTKPRDRYEEDRKKLHAVRDNYLGLWHTFSGVGDLPLSWRMIDGTDSRFNIRFEIWNLVITRLDELARMVSLD